MFADSQVAVIIPAFDEEQTIAAVVAEFLAGPGVDRVLVVDNRSSDATAERARAAGAEVIREEQPGYGCALRAGLDHAAADGFEILVLTEADGSFRAADLPKLLHYLGDAQMVLGTRTTRQLVEQGANMDFLLRWGNVAAAKLLELCWFFPHEPRLTDVGCTFRALWRDAWLQLAGRLREPGPAFSPEMICEAYARGLRTIEIPVTYGARLGGRSKHSRGRRQTLRTGLSMLRTILRKRLGG